MSDEAENQRSSGNSFLRRPTYISFAATSSLSVPEERLIVASLTVAERRQQLQTKADFDAETSKSHQVDAVMSESEPVLVKLCRQQSWDKVLERCATHPEEATPITIPQIKQEKHSPRRVAIRPRVAAGYLGGMGAPMVVYSDTPLGIVCTSEFECQDTMLVLVNALVKADPNQVQSSQRISGHTPLRSAVQNPSCTVEVLRALIETDIALPGKPCTKSINMKDRDGLEVIDHLIMGVHVAPSDNALLLVNLFLQSTRAVNRLGHGKECSCGLTVSPLIRLLSMGTSYGLNVQSGRGVKARGSQEARLGRILAAGKLIVEESKPILQVRARSTQCTALHIALRNYGDCLPLIQFLLEMDEAEFMIKQRNLYGDLPLHVACSVGVPPDVLAFIVKCTTKAAKSDVDTSHPLIWSTNISGYTAVDLEWMRHIEGGRGFFESRPFYPLEACGIRWHCSRQDAFYRELLEEAVNKVLQEDRASHECSKIATDMFGVMLDRILFLIKVAHEGIIPKDAKDVRRNLMHAASSLCRLPGPALPKAMLDLIHWMHPEQIFQLDKFGRSPLHYSAMPGSSRDEVTLETRRKDHVIIKDYIGWTDHLLRTCPEAAQVVDSTGRIPLHYILQGSSVASIEPWGKVAIADRDNEMVRARNHVLWDLIAAFPQSVEEFDPSTGLYPFMTAAANPSMSLDMVDRLLRRSPTLVQQGRDS